MLARECEEIAMVRDICLEHYLSGNAEVTSSFRGLNDPEYWYGSLEHSPVAASMFVTLL